MNWQCRKVLVTGAAGFTGNHLTDELVRIGATTRLRDHDSPGDRLWRTVQRRHYPDWPADVPLTTTTIATRHDLNAL